jgi:anthranilate synthase component 1
LLVPVIFSVVLGKIPFSSAPEDDRELPEMHLSLYNDVILFDQATKIIYAISWVHLDPASTGSSSTTTSSSSSREHSHAAASSSSRPSGNGKAATASSSSTSSGSITGSDMSSEQLRKCYEAGQQRLQHMVDALSRPPPCLSVGTVDMSLAQLPAPPGTSNMTEKEFLDAVLAAKEYILVSHAASQYFWTD